MSTIKKIDSISGFASAMNDLSNNLSGSKEKGFMLSNKAGNEVSSIFEGNNQGDIGYYDVLSEMNNEQAAKTYGAAHNHLNNNPDFANKHIGIPTPEDFNILAVLGSIETSTTNPYRDTIPKKAIALTKTNKGLFALKIKDNSNINLDKLITFNNKWQNMSFSDKREYIEDNIKDEFKYNMTPSASENSLIVGLLSFIEDEDIGVEVYKKNVSNGGSWDKLVLIEDSIEGGQANEFIKVPCD